MKLSDFSTLAEAQLYEETSQKMISPDLMLAFLTTFGLIDILDTLSENANAVMTQEAKALRKAFAFGSEFNFINGHPSSVAGMLAKMVADGVITETFADYCIAYANPTKRPFADATHAQFNNSKGLYSTRAINYITGNDIILTLNTNLPERVAATVWRKETGFADENAGRNAYVQTSQKYRIDMSGKKSGKYEVRIPMVDADFTVESV